MSAALLPRPKFTSSGSSNEFGLLGRLAPRHAIRDGGLGKAVTSVTPVSCRLAERLLPTSPNSTETQSTQ